LSSLRFGIAYPDISQEAFAFKANTKVVISAFEEVADVTLYELDDLSGAVEIVEGFTIALFSLSESDWVVAIPCSKRRFFPESLVGKVQALSEIISDSAVYISTTDTGDFACFWHYRAGELIDKLENVYERVRGYEGRELNDELLNYLLEHEPNFVTDMYFHHIDSLENIDEVLPIDQRCRGKNSFTLTDQFMQRQKIFLPDPLELNYFAVDGERLQFKGLSGIDFYCDQLVIIVLHIG